MDTRLWYRRGARFKASAWDTGGGLAPPPHTTSG